MKFIVVFFVFTAALMKANDALGFFLGQNYNKDGSIQLGLLCNEAEIQNCFAICSEELGCQMQEPLCRSCSGSEEINLRVMLTRWTYFYEISNTTVPLSELVPLFQAKRVILLDRETVFNFHRGFGSPEVFENMGKACGKNEKDFHLMVQIDDEGNPQKLLGLICDNNETTTPLRMTLREKK